MEYEQLTPDAETFARVWKRVMPDEALSQIVVHQPGSRPPGNRPSMGRPPRPAPPPGGDQRGDEALLQELLEQWEQGADGVAAILRRMPWARGLGEEMDRSGAQLRSAWYMLTGRPWPQRRRGGGKDLPLPQLLREQYLWELEFSRLLQRAGREMKGEDLRELVMEQEQASRRRRRMLRSLLSRV